MRPQQKKKAFLYAGIGFIVVGVVSMAITYMLFY